MNKAVICPECSGSRIYKDGVRYNHEWQIQRFLCRDCGFRFSNNPYKQCQTKIDYQLCVIKKAKKLDSQTEIKTVAGDEKASYNLTGQLVKFLSALENEGIKANTANLYLKHLRNLVSDGAELCDPDSVKAIIAKNNWANATRNVAVAAYSKFLNLMGGSWKPPKYRTVRKLPYIPTENELNCLINAANRKLSTYLYLLKCTGMRSMEAWCLQWKDVDFTRNGITMNETLKHGNPRMFKVNSKLTAMLNNLPKKSDKYIFSDTPTQRKLCNLSVTFRNIRKKLAFKMQNPNLNKISFHTFRHWYATMEYHKTKNLRYVQERLGHKSILTTTLYTHLINFEADSYHSAVAKTIDEAKKLIEAGFEYVTDLNDVKLFRKPK